MDQNGAAKNMNKTETSKKVQYFIITIYNYPRKIQKGSGGSGVFVYEMIGILFKG